MELILRLAWRNIWRHKRRSMATAMAMAVGVSMSFGMMALTDGMYGQMFRILVVKTIGHAQIHQKDFPKHRALHESIPEGQKLREELRALPEVKALSARTYGFALFAAGDEATGAQITGILPKDEAALTDVASNIVDGRFLRNEAEQGIVMGYRLADKLKVKVGDELVAVTQAADGSMGNELYTLLGTLRTGSTAIDMSGAFLHLDDADLLLALGGRLHEIALLAPENDKVGALVEAVQGKLPGGGDEDGEVIVRDWGTINPMTKQMLSMQDLMLGILIFLVLGVAGLGVLNTMLMSVFERTKELGVAIALGLKPIQVVQLIVMETVFLAFLATTIGGILGGLLDLWLVKSGIPMSFSDEGISFAGITMDPVIHGYVRAEPIIIILVMVFVVSIISSLWPALRAARLKPVVAMREE